MGATMERYFSSWLHWTDRNDYYGIEYPGIYIVAISDKDISDKAFRFRKEIVYVGMTNGVAGLKGRLVQFDNTIAQRRPRPQHGGADRLLHKHRKYGALTCKLYVA